MQHENETESDVKFTYTRIINAKVALEYLLNTAEHSLSCWFLFQQKHRKKIKLYTIDSPLFSNIIQLCYAYLLQHKP